MQTPNMPHAPAAPKDHKLISPRDSTKDVDMALQNRIIAHWDSISRILIGKRSFPPQKKNVLFEEDPKF